MAGRYLLIEFDDEATASHLREQIDVASRKGKGYRVVGLFARPGNFCKCGAAWVNGARQQAQTKRGAKYGWQVCLNCKRPVPVMSFLKNLIKPSDIISAPSYDIVNHLGKPQAMGFYTHGLTAVSNGYHRFTETED